MNKDNIIFQNKQWIQKPKTNIFIYCWENQINNKKYIGQTRIGQKRLYDEASASNIGPIFYNAIKKYSIKNFICYILEYCQLDELNEKEQYWITFFNTTDDKNGYNITSGGDQYHKKTSPVEQRDLQGNWLKTYDNLYEAAQHIQTDTYIIRVEDNIRKAITGTAKTAYGYKWNYQNQPYNARNNSAWRKIAQYNLQGILINTYPNIKQAAEQNDIDYKNLWSTIQRPSCIQTGGYMWRCFIEEPMPYIEPYIDQLPYKIVQYDLNNNIIAQFTSIKEAALISGDSRIRISLCCNGHQEYTHGHRWAKIFKKELEIKWKF